MNPRVTDAQGQVLERTRYAPYGQVLNRPLRDGPGYTGHREDAATGLVYMQQRYYDPESGRFLSVDPVEADAETGGNFSRYWYANDNPYRFADPDGRQSCTGSHIGGAACASLNLTVIQVHPSSGGGAGSQRQSASSSASSHTQTATASHANSSGAASSSQNHVAHPANGIDTKRWEFRQELTAGNTATVDSSGGIAVQSGGVAGPLPTDQFRYMVTQRPLNANGTYQSIMAPIDWGNPRSYSSGLVGYGVTHTMIFHALPGPGGNRWFVRFPLQESAHGNASNEYLDIYVPRQH